MKIGSDIRQFVKLIFGITLLSYLYSSMAAFVYVGSMILRGNNGPSDKYQTGIIQPLIISIAAIVIVTLVVKIAVSFNEKKREKKKIGVLNKNFVPIVFISFVLSLVVADIGVEISFYVSGMFFPDLILGHKVYMAGLYISLASVVASLVVVLGSRYDASAKNFGNTIPME